MKKLVAFHYFGGKSGHLDWLYSLLPERCHLVEGMCGAASVGLNATHALVTINDLNNDVINFFKVLRDHYPEFKEKLKLTPFSREEFYAAAKPSRNKVEKARRFFIRSLQGFAGQGCQNEEKAWGYEISSVNFYNGKQRGHYRVDTWQGKLEALDAIAFRLRGIQIEHDTVLNIVDRYNKPSVCLYLDPPYVRSLRSDKKRYRHEYTDGDHVILAQKLEAFTGYVAVSGYEGDMYDEIFPAPTWTKSYGQILRTNTKKKERQEVLWTNYDPAITRSQQQLF